MDTEQMQPDIVRCHFCHRSIDQLCDCDEYEVDELYKQPFAVCAVCGQNRVFLDAAHDNRLICLNCEAVDENAAILDLVLEPRAVSFDPGYETWEPWMDDPVRHI